MSEVRSPEPCDRSGLSVIVCELTYGELAIDLEAAHALDFVIEEVQTVGELGGKGIDVYNAPTQGELPGS